MGPDSQDRFDSTELTQVKLFDCVAKGDIKTLRRYSPEAVSDAMYDVLIENQHTKKDYRLRDRRSADGDPNSLIHDWNMMMRHNVNANVPRVDLSKSMQYLAEMYISFTKLLVTIYSRDTRLRDHLLHALSIAADVEPAGDDDDSLLVAEERSRATIKGILRGTKSADPEWGEELERAYREDSSQ